MITAAKIFVLTLGLIDARVSMLDGKSIEGEVVSLDTEQVVLKTSAEQPVSVPIAHVIDVTFLHAADASSEKVVDGLEIGLVDGSEMLVSEIAASSAQVTANTADFGELKIPRRAVRSVRLQPMKDEFAAEWASYLQRDNATDLLIVAKRDGSGLDHLSGVVTSIGEKEVPFIRDGDEIPAPRERIFGIVFAKGDQTTKTHGGLVLRLTQGHSIEAATATLESGEVVFGATWGQKLSVSVEHISTMDFSAGRIHYLSDLEPLSERYYGLEPVRQQTENLFSADADTRTGLSVLWRMSRDCFPNDGKSLLTLRGQEYAKGLCIFPKAQIDYALDGQYTRLNAIVGVDDEVAFNQQKGRPPTAVELRIEADGAEIFRQLIVAPDDPLPIDLKLKGISTLSLIVDFGDDSSTCDYLDLVNARLIVDTSEK
ncbi:MAG: NPCBM/NEW2 domain-containing protein [Fuerstiella sp.]|nr:NPCBM/NEW2 domain-containing protein [Fuerstiella sp.]